MVMNERERPYVSYLLRLWLVHNHEGAVWRCSIQNVQTGKQQGFDSPESFCKFLQEATAHTVAVDSINDDCIV